MPSVTVRMTLTGCNPSSGVMAVLTLNYSSMAVRWLEMRERRDWGTLMMVRLLE
jgi:hypothetical protein